MKTLLIWTMLAVPVFGQEFVVENKIAPTCQFVVENKIAVSAPRVVIPVPEPAPSANIFADYPADKLRAALQPPAQPVARAVRPNQGSCVCNRTGGDCLCQPASLCAQGRCPALTQLRAVEVPYYFPNPTYCPPGRP